MRRCVRFRVLLLVCALCFLTACVGPDREAEIVLESGGTSVREAGEPTAKENSARESGELAAAAPSGLEDPAWGSLQPEGHMELVYARQFSVDYYSGGYALITIAGNDRFLLLPENAVPPEGLDDDITALRQPLDNIYLAASSAMDFFRELDRLDRVRLTSTTAANWSIPEVLEALDNGDILYAGRYSAPDYELLLDQKSSLAIESTMIYHSPETAEQLEALGIPVMVERSSYEPHPLGRMEWIKLYGLLAGAEEEAEAFFDGQMVQLDSILEKVESEDRPSVAFFYISSNGSANVRKPGDYISQLIEMAGGRYVFDNLDTGDNDLSTLNMQMESFYAGARDADILIYNSTIDAELETLDQLLQKSGLLADFKAVQSGNVWCTGKDMYQQVTGLGDLLADLHSVISGQAGDGENLTFLHRLR